MLYHQQKYRFYFNVLKESKIIYISPSLIYRNLIGFFFSLNFQKNVFIS